MEDITKPFQVIGSLLRKVQRKDSIGKCPTCGRESKYLVKLCFSCDKKCENASMREKDKIEKRVRENALGQKVDTTRFCGYCGKNKIDITTEPTNPLKRHYYCVHCKKKRVGTLIDE